MKRLKITPVKHAQSGRWQVRIPAKLSGTGKRETKYFPTKAEAIGYISNLEDVAAGLHLGETLMTRSEYDAIIEELARLAPFDVTLKDVIDYYIARHRASDARKISILEPLYRDTLQDASSHYRSRVRQVLGAFASVFGDCLIDDVTQDEFEKWLAGWKTTPPSYNSALRHIKPFFTWAISKKYAVQSPAEGIKQRKHQRMPISILTPAQAHSLLDACRDYSGDEKMPKNLHVNASDMKIAVAVLLFAGVRPEEVTALTWEHVKLAHGYIRVEPEVSKTNSVRLVQIEPNLKAWLETVPEEKRTGKLSPKNWQRKWQAVRRRAGISRLNDVCRHSYASYWLAAHRDTHGLLENMGHTTSKTTIKYYLTACNPEEVPAYWQISPEDGDSLNSAG